MPFPIAAPVPARVSDEVRNRTLKLAWNFMELIAQQTSECRRKRYFQVESRTWPDSIPASPRSVSLAFVRGFVRGRVRKRTIDMGSMETSR